MSYNIEIKTLSEEGYFSDYTMELWINGVEIMSGDEYHNKISVAIDSFIEGLTFASPETQVNITKTEIKL